MAFRRGEIYYGFDSLKNSNRRVLIVSRDELNNGDYVVVVAFTTKRLAERKELANCVFFPEGSQPGLDEDCVMQGESVAVIPVQYLDLQSDVLGTVEDGKMEQVIAAIGHVIAANCFPEQ